MVLFILTRGNKGVLRKGLVRPIHRVNYCKIQLSVTKAYVLTDRFTV